MSGSAELVQAYKSMMHFPNGVKSMTVLEKGSIQVHEVQI